MEKAFGGVDFSQVKVHNDAVSDQLNQSIQARAFTTGQDVFFRGGEYNPGSRGGQELLAHELTHVVQQSGGALHGGNKTDISLLSQYITIPEGVKAVAWVVVPLGNAESIVPGLTDTVIYAFVNFKNNNWSSIKELSVTNLNTSITELPEKIAQKIIPTRELKKLARKKDNIRVEGTRYNPTYFNKGVYRGIYAVQIGDGLLISLQTF
ncbi:MAG: hypothetical protein AN488_00015 [Anabaena sp. WA113]|jgi:hypothetical protein|nr:MAG: hypothetical protein AN488_00015 [Anabaena sp. WA113]